MEPSTNSTIECMILSAWTTISISLSSSSKKYFASMTSSPLFIMVAESIVTLLPIFQLGCFKACSGVMSLSSSLEVFLKGPPDAVKISLCILSFSNGFGKHWKIALISLSTGKSLTLCFFAALCTREPHITKTSLFTKARSLPASIASSVGSKPMLPPMASRTSSASSIVATAEIPISPDITSTDFKSLSRC